MSDIVWQDPPPVPPPVGRQKPSKYAVLAEALRERPGQWALATTLGSDSSTITSYLKKRLGPGFEVTSRRNGDKRDVYARYVGEAS